MFARTVEWLIVALMIGMVVMALSFAGLALMQLASGMLVPCCVLGALAGGVFASKVEVGM